MAGKKKEISLQVCSTKPLVSMWLYQHQTVNEGKVGLSLTVVL